MATGVKLLIISWHKSHISRCSLLKIMKRRTPEHAYFPNMSLAFLDIWLVSKLINCDAVQNHKHLSHYIKHEPSKLVAIQEMCVL